ncbi:MAG TPA: ATP-binding protein [Candidatus Omnitrophota bacterium]|jgi:MinD superfamily P-loop ATPase|nr:ATP-binding protein [Candidatus Omnitrophota bacterium]HQB12007.1 ATP-binding protein [Candidatus Omnitrophota bacterium]
MIISVASGKGGTGKTTVAVNLALALGDCQLLDCDVEEPNAQVFLKADIRAREPATVRVPEIDYQKCDFCGKCGDVCAYHALAVLPRKVLFFPQMCHSCGACEMLCPRKAIRETDRTIGEIETGDREGIRFVQGKLNVGETMAPPLIRQVKSRIEPNSVAILDAPPGTSCPMVTAVRGSDFCILVTEPTPFGMNDLHLAIETVKKLGIPYGVVVNRAEADDLKTRDYFKSNQIPLLLKIPLDRKIAELYSIGTPFIGPMPEYREKFRALFKTISETVRVSS